MVEIEEMRRRFDNSPYAVFLGMTVEDLSRGYAKVKMQLKKDFLNWDDLVQGGAIGSLIDQAFGCALNTLENVYVAVQLNINFITAAPAGETVHAEARVLRAGKTVGIVEMKVVDSKGKVVATATGTSVSRGART